MALRSTTIANSAQITGTATNDNAAAGYIGQYIESIITNASATAVSSSGVAQNLTSISLTAGDWDVSGLIGGSPSISSTQMIGGISTTTGTQPAVELQTFEFYAAAAGRTSVALPRIRISIAATTTVYAVLTFTFTGTATMYGFINARRVR